VHGPIDKNLVLSGLELRPIQSAEEMQFAMEAEFDKADIVIMAAAVADYRPKNVGQEKMKKSKTEISLELVKNPDILLNLGKRKKSQILVGFALETQDEFENAKKKMIGKNLDFIVVNNPKNEGAGFEHNTNQVSIIFPNDKIKEVPKSQKSEIAEIIVDEIVALK
jgi:phosphopantothenoylcysteine decarboxylase/phosphopantothenate--cysteine ligase